MMIAFTCSKCTGKWSIPKNQRNNLIVCPFCLSPVLPETEVSVQSFEEAILQTSRILGIACLLSRDMFLHYLSSHYPDYKKELKIFSNICTDEVLRTLYDTRGMDQADASKVLKQVQHRLVEDEGIAQNWATAMTACIFTAIHPPQTTTNVPRSSAKQLDSSEATSERNSPKPKAFVCDGTLVKYCGSKESFTMPDGISVIGEAAFFGNPVIKSVHMSRTGTLLFEYTSNIRTIESKAFALCTQLATVHFSNEIRRIDSEAFYGCRNLKELSLPDNLTTLGSLAFAFCTNLTKVRFPRTMHKLSEDVFLGCNNIRQVWCSTQCAEDVRKAIPTARITKY